MTLEELGSRQLADGPSVNADYCEVSTATRLLGDRWSLLVVRELFVGNTRFTEIQEALPGLSRGLLASRLGYLTRLGIVDRRVADGTDLRAKYSYALSDSGKALGPVLTALGDWAAKWKPPTATNVGGEAMLDLEQLRESFDPSALPADRMQIQFLLSDSDAAWLRADRTGVRACRGVNEGSPDLVIRTSLSTLNGLYWGQSTCREAIARHDISFEGPMAYAQAFSGWFANRPAVRGVESDGPDRSEGGDAEKVQF